MARALGVLVAVGALSAVVFGPAAKGSSSVSFDVIFDDARGLIGGQLVKVAGAQAGTIQNVVVTPDFKARVEATIDSRFMPFHRDATCTIRPQGLIAENYIDCNPGTPGSPALTGSGGNPPTVPVTHTTEPVSLLDLFNIFNVPTTERLQVLIDELGIGTSARGADFNAILLRANPTLALARQAISILAHQKHELATIVDASNTIAAQGAGHTRDLQSFLVRTAALSALTAQHREPLSQTVARLPRLLAAAQPALAQLNTVALDGTPLLEQIHAAVPSLNRASSDLGTFVAAAKPGLAKLTVALKQGIPAIRATTPVVKTLGTYVRKSLPGAQLFGRLSTNLQRHGFVENFLSVTYYIAASLARFDATSHMLSLFLVGAKNGACSKYATKPVAGCSAHYGAGAAYRPSHGSNAGHARKSGATVRHKTTQPSKRTGSEGGRARPAPGAGSQPIAGSTPLPAPAVPAASAVHQSAQTLQSLMNYLIK